MLFHCAARALRSHPRLVARRFRLACATGASRGSQPGPPHDLVTRSAAMTWLMAAAEPASPMGDAPKKMVTGLVSTAMMVSESPLTLRVVSAIVMSASTRAALTPSTVIDDVFVGPRVGDAFE